MVRLKSQQRDDDDAVPEVILAEHSVVSRPLDGDVHGCGTVRVFRHEVSDVNRLTVAVWLDGSGRHGNQQDQQPTAGHRRRAMMVHRCPSNKFSATVSAAVKCCCC